MGVFLASLSLELLCLAGVLAFLLYRSFKSGLRYFDDLGIPYVPAKGLLENNAFGAFSKVSLGETYDGLYKKLSPHKYGGFFNALRPCLLLRDPRLVASLLTTSFHSFNDHGLPTDEQANPMEANLFFLSGPKWKALRRKLSPTFTSGKLKGMFGLIGDCADDLVRHVSATLGQDHEMKDLLARFTTDVIGTCAFGLEPESMKNPNSKFREMGKKFFNPSIPDIIKTILRFKIPWIFKKLGIPTQSKEVTAFFQSLIAQTVDHRMRTGEKRNDFVQLLVQLKEKGFVEHDPTDLEMEAEEEGDHEAAVKLEFTDALLAAQAFVFFVAGFETTASTISFTLYLLAKNKEARGRAREEVRNAKAVKGSIDYEAVKSMPYLEACIEESMRLYPPIQALPRECTKDYVMEDGVLIKKGTRIFIPIYSIHRDPDFYPEPEVFRPERFMGEEKKNRVPGSYIPFGYGPRICIAQRFALLEATLCLAKLLDSFEFFLSPRMEEPLRLVSQTFVVSPAGGLWLRFQKLPA